MSGSRTGWCAALLGMTLLAACGQGEIATFSATRVVTANCRPSC